jgi:hypothetical protein
VLGYYGHRLNRRLCRRFLKKTAGQDTASPPGEHLVVPIEWAAKKRLAQSQKKL